MENVTVRFAKLTEAEDITTLINYYAGNGLMLPRRKEEVIENIRNYLVALFENKVIGCCALSFFTEEIAEIRSLAVAENFRGKGIGRKLVIEAENVLKEEGISRVFVLTYQHDFFKKLGYEVVDKTTFPQKIWRDCLSCSKIMKCDEIAMQKIIG